MIHLQLTMPVIETERLLLRGIELEDASDMFAYYSEPMVVRYLTLVSHTSIEDTLYMLRTQVLPYEKRCIPQTWGIVLKEKEKVIGDLSIHTIEDDIGQIGYVLHHDYGKQGIMKEALLELLKVGFHDMGLRRIEAYYEVQHIRSAKLLHGLGFKKEGILRQYAKLSDGFYHDMVLVSLLKEEFIEGEKIDE
ncbi:MAG: GNAT family protein [Longicatena sp.]